MTPATLAVDFGTSNTAAAILDRGRVLRLPIDAGADTLPTAIFFPVRGEAARIGQAAGEALIAGMEGRYMRALKSVLGTPLLHEQRLIGGRRQSLSDVIAAFLAELRLRAEAFTGLRLTRALSGRPVHFHSADNGVVTGPDSPRDRQAEDDLRGCYLAAGFDDVAFRLEPEAAALACHGLGASGAAGLIVDIGGGTSDFSVFRADGDKVRILASHGIRLGGTNFDHVISMQHVMPLLGHGGDLRREMGPGRLPMPNALFVDLATWEKIPFLYTPEARREALRLKRLAFEPGKLGRLVTVIEEEHGHELAFAVERGKIAANGPEGDARIAMGGIEPGLAARLTAGSLDRAMADFGLRLRGAAEDTIRLAGLTPESIGTVILVGGSSLMRFVRDGMAALCPAARIEQSEAFTAVVDGLALATAGPDGVQAAR